MGPDCVVHRIRAHAAWNSRDSEDRGHQDLTMTLVLILGIGLFLGFVFLILVLSPRPSAAGALLEQVTRPVRVQDEKPAWRAAMEVDFLAKPFTLIRSLFSPEPDPQLVKRLMLAGYRKSAHADIFLGSRLAFPAVLGLMIALFVGS